MAKHTGDPRDALSALAGRLNVKRLIEDEVELLRSRISAGERHLISILPGMEIELERLRQSLESVHQVNGDAAVPAPQALLPPPGAVDFKSLGFTKLRSRRIPGSLTLPVLLLRELTKGPVETGDIVTKYGTIFKINRHSVQQLVLVLRRKGLEVPNVGLGTYELRTPVVNIPEELPPPPVRRPVGRPRKITAKQPKPPKRPGTPYFGDKTIAQVLLEAFEANPARTVDIPYLTRKHNLHHKSLYWAMKQLRQKGYDFKAVSRGMFKLIKKGTP
jgi:hypothetical protein